MTRLQDVFTIRRDCFLPCGDTTRLMQRFRGGATIFWDPKWNLSSTKALVHFCDGNPSGYGKRIPKPDVFMCSPVAHEPTSPHPIYPEDMVFSDAADSIGMRWGRIYQRGYTNIQCTGMLPLMLNKTVGTGHPKGWPHAHLLDVQISDPRNHGRMTMLVWQLSTKDVLKILVDSNLPIQYFWDRQAYQQDKVDVLPHVRAGDLGLKYYIGSKPHKRAQRVARFKGVQIYDVSSEYGVCSVKSKEDSRCSKN